MDSWMKTTSKSIKKCVKSSKCHITNFRGRTQKSSLNQGLNEFLEDKKNKKGSLPTQEITKKQERIASQLFKGLKMVEMGFLENI